MVEYIIVGVISALLGWVGHVVWFSLYRRRFMFSSTKRFNIVTNERLTLMFTEVWDSIPEGEHVEEEIVNDFIIIGEEEND